MKKQENQVPVDKNDQMTQFLVQNNDPESSLLETQQNYNNLSLTQENLQRAK